MSKIQLREVAELARVVFSTHEGQQLLDKLEKLTAIVFDANTNIMYTNAAQNDFVQQLKIFANITESDLQEIETAKQENEIPDSLFNDFN